MPERPDDFEPGLGAPIPSAAAPRREGRPGRGHDRLAELADLAGGMAHEFNNVLAVILSSAGFLAESLPAGSPLAADLERIQEAAERGARLTRQFLGDPGERSGRVALDLASLLDHVEWIVGRTGGADLRVRRRGKLPAVLGDSRELEQLLLTLVLPHPHDADRPRSVAVEAAAGADGRVVVAVTSPVAARRFGDTLALATAHNLARRAGVELDVDDGDPSVLAVRLMLPAAGEPLVDLRPTAAGESRHTVLVVDDEPALLLVTARLLRDAGYAVLEAAGGDEALQLVDANRVDIVLTDVVMPRMTGVELAERLAALAEPPTVVFMSGFSDGLLEATPGNRVPLLQKPFSREQLLDHVAAHVPATSPRRGV